MRANLRGAGAARIGAAVLAALTDTIVKGLNSLCMKMLAIPVAIFALIVCSRAEEVKFREIRATALNADGSPAAGRHVTLVGLSRGSSTPSPEDAAARAAWEFVTDEKGSFTAKLGEFATWEDKAGRPGWGTYALVVDESDRDAGAVSEYLVNDSPEKNQGRGEQADSEWPAPLAVPPGGLDLALEIKEGVTLTGRVLGWPDGSKPLAGIRVYTNNDLYSDSHSGHGGEILERSAETAADGTFTIAHIYPVRFHVGIGGPYGFRSMWSDAGYWLKTKTADGAWQDGPADVLVPPARDKTLSVEMMAAEKPLFIYRGRVTSTNGKPVAGAEVTYAVSFHPDTGTFEDSHTFLKTTSGADGGYEIALPTPWVRGLVARAQGYEEFARWDEDEKLFLAPGTHDLTLTPDRLPGEKKP